MNNLNDPKNFNVQITLSNIPPEAWRNTFPPYPFNTPQGQRPYAPTPPGVNLSYDNNISTITVTGDSAGVVKIGERGAIDIDDAAGLCNLYFSVVLKDSNQVFTVQWGVVIATAAGVNTAGRWSWAGSNTAAPPCNLLVFNPSYETCDYEYYIVISSINDGVEQYAVIDPRLQTR
ncbi:MAG: hypothetical protein RIQ60_4028 [Pseudomonadota bacterium]|jgi:hypothetical protein